MNRLTTMLALLVIHSTFAVSARSADAPDGMRFEVPVIPGVERYTGLLEQPAYLAVALENVGLSPSMSSKLKIGEQGRLAEIRNAFVRFTGHRGTVYAFDAGIALGLGDTKIDFPVTVDLAELPNGKAVITLRPPLAKLVPTELSDRIRIKLQLVANAGAQKKLLDHLDQLSGAATSSGATVALPEAILADAYNRSGGPGGPGADRGDAVPLSEQWMLIATLVIWLVVLPVVLLYQRRRRGKTVAR